MRPARRDTGSATLELVVLAPGLLLFLALVIFAGRFALARQAVQAAATEAARSASIARIESTARSEATAAARGSLERQQLSCVSTSVALDTSGFGTPVGSYATVEATVTCVVRFADLALPGTPGTTRVTARMTSALDTYRARS